MVTLHSGTSFISEARVNQLIILSKLIKVRKITHVFSYTFWLFPAKKLSSLYRILIYLVSISGVPASRFQP